MLTDCAQHDGQCMARHSNQLRQLRRVDGALGMVTLSSE